MLRYTDPMRRVSATLAGLMLVLCAGRVASWAATPKTGHACCPQEQGHAPKTFGLSDCCVQALKPVLLRVQAPEFYTAVPIVSPLSVRPLFVRLDSPAQEAPPGQAFLASAASRAPPLA